MGQDLTVWMTTRAPEPLKFFGGFLQSPCQSRRMIPVGALPPKDKEEADDGSPSPSVVGPNNPEFEFVGSSDAPNFNPRLLGGGAH